jgi:hypothetical protein
MLTKRTNFYLTLGIRLTCEFVILCGLNGDLIKENKIIFLVFLKYWPSSHDFHKLVIKGQNAC